MTREQRDELRRDAEALSNATLHVKGSKLLWLLDAADEAERLREELADERQEADIFAAALSAAAARKVAQCRK